MSPVKMPEEINRRRFLGAGAMAIAAAQFGTFEVLTVSAQEPRPPLADEGPMPHLGEFLDPGVQALVFTFG
jgi:hypothetical protein